MIKTDLSNLRTEINWKDYEPKVAAINKMIDDDAIVCAAAGSLPGDMQGLWRARKINTYHMEYGYSCMGYEIASALGAKLACPDQEVYDYLNVVRRRAGIPDVEVAWRNARDPQRVTYKEGMREIIRQEWNIEFAFEGMRYWNVRRWKIANTELNDKVYGWNVVGSDAQSFYNNGNGPVVVYSGNKFVAPRDYLYPIRSEEVQRAGCVQNPRW